MYPIDFNVLKVRKLDQQDPTSLPRETSMGARRRSPQLPLHGTVIIRDTTQAATHTLECTQRYKEMEERERRLNDLQGTNDETQSLLTAAEGECGTSTMVCITLILLYSNWIIHLLGLITFLGK